MRLIEGFGARLKEERIQHGVTQQALCDAAHIGTATYSRYEKNSSKPDAEFLVWLYENGFDVHYILTSTRIHAAKEAEKRYTSPEDALYSVLDAQDRLGIMLDSEPLKSAIGYAYTAQLDTEEIYQFIKAAHEVLDVPINTYAKNKD